ncbi:MAG: hypothetical protein P0119_14825 [Nitrospira sp.]|nr:hypothetical protein [Nitrospira sp.]
MGGAILLRLYFELMGLRATLAPLLVPFAKTSNNQIPAVDVLLAWWYGLALGAERFEHLTRYRRDPLLPRLLGLPRFPSPDTLRRFFQGFTYRRTTEVAEALMRMSLGAMRPIQLGIPWIWIPLSVLGSKKWTPSTYNERSGGVRWNRCRDSSIQRNSGSRQCGWSWNSR